MPQLPLEGASLHRRGACLLLGAALGFAGARRRVRAEAALTEEQKMAILQEGIGTFGQRNFGGKIDSDHSDDDERWWK